ncbi:MAG: glycosyltransferase [Nanoarchaeota archaeon]
MDESLSENKNITPDADYLFEASFEVCNKVGGIYTVLKSKVELMDNAYQNYFLIGPLNKTKIPKELEQCSPPDFIKEVFDELSNKNIHCIFGKWKVKGKPYVILIDFYSLSYQVNVLKKMLYEDYDIETHNSSWEFEEPMLWCYAIYEFLNLIVKKLPGKKVVSHFHEWMAGISLLFLKKYNVDISTVFTTHATILGRSIAGRGKDLYGMLENMNPHKEAIDCCVLDKFTTEKACANNANVFTTVSEITSIEAEKILGRRPDILLLNGLDIDKFPSFEESSILHVKYREKLREFISYKFFPHYDFDLKQSLFFYISGRYEFKNKGVDMYIDALSKLNERLKSENFKKTIIAFFFIPTGVKGIKNELIENKEKYDKLKNLIKKLNPKINKKLILNLISNKNIDDDFYLNLLDKEDIDKLKNNDFYDKNSDFVDVCTHKLFDEENDSILNNLKEKNLLNRKEDKVKIVFYPVYLDIFDNLLNLDYYDVISGCHLGVFPSYYEPWGYTPLESAVFGVPCITSNLAGFGKFIKENTTKNEGVFVVDRLDKNYDESVNSIFEIFYKYSNLDKNKRARQKIIAKKLSELADWKDLVNNYYKAHNLALSQKFN